MSIFGSSPRRVSSDEFRRVRSTLRSRGLSDRSIKTLELVFRGDLDEKGDKAGIDSKELERGLDWLRKNRSKHGLSDKAIEEATEQLKKYL